MAVEFNKVKVIGDFDKNNFRGIVGANTPPPPHSEIQKLEGELLETECR